MTAITPNIRLFTTQDDSTARIQINSLVIEHRGNHYNLQGGTKDTIHVFTQSIALYVLTVNRSLGYMGLNAYMSPEPDAINTIFLHTPGEIVDRLGEGWEELAPETIVKNLIDYLM